MPSAKTIAVVKDTQVDLTLNNIYTPLQFTFMCSNDPSQELRWRVRDHTDGPIDETWRIVDGDESAPSGFGTAPPIMTVATAFTCLPW